MRKLMWFTIGFGIACGLCAWLWQIRDLLLIAGGLAMVSLGLLAFLRRIGWIRRFAVLLLGIALGFGWFEVWNRTFLEEAATLDGETAEIIARCDDYGYATGYGTAVDATVYLEDCTCRARLYFSSDAGVEPGDYLKGSFLFRITTPGGIKDSTHHQGKGIFLLGYQTSDVQLAKPEQLPWQLYPALLRQQITALLDELLPPDTEAFAKALLIGNREGIDYETNTAFKVTGIMHIIAVSGLHVSILFSLIYTLGLRRRWIVALIGIPALVLFAAVAGFSPSVVRACIMQILMILAMLFDREYDGPTELSFAALVMLACNPLVITSVSFQLSVGCMAGIFLFHGMIYTWMTEKLGCEKKRSFVRLKRWFAGSVSVTLSAMSLTTPLVAYHFDAVSLVGILTNLLTLWAVNIIFYGLIAMCIVGSFSAFAGGILAVGVSGFIRYVLLTAKLLAKFPLAAVYTRSVYIFIWLVFVYVLLAVFLFSRKRRPGTLLCCGVIGLCLALAASWIEPMTDGCRMTVLDVGQGQSIILQSEGKAYLVDCGGSYDEDAADLAAETLMSQGVFRLDGIILTHFDRDHSGGLPHLLTRMKADALFMPDALDENGVGEKLEELTGGTVVYVREDLRLTYGETELTVFGPAVTNSDNESSLAVLFQAENCDILITGDRSGFGERMLLRQMELPRLEILVAGHHGAKSSTCTELLDATRPAIAAISVGTNPYGHPADELLNRLEEYGILVYRTDLNGNLIFRR
ncbi:MAG: DNA internalization-related competence protein ComEC/Rec2 [Oscillospiraceae bacterium]|nr:DNA internalization-related competence protein ComEC/Rec2 [Oscillospiraceae bacterium]